MQETVVIVLHASKEEVVDWTLLSYEGHVLQRGLDTHLRQLKDWCKARKVCVIVPAVDVTLATITLPDLPHARLLQAVPYALEESLIDDVSSLHFAIAEKKQGAPLAVAILSEAKMTQWLSQLHAHDIVPDALFPAQFAVPFLNETISILLETPVIVRFNEQEALVCDESTVSAFLTSFQENKKRIVYGEKNILENADWVKCSPMQLLELKAKTIFQAKEINLLQGKFKSKHSGFSVGNLKKRLILSLFAAWVGLLLLSPIVSYLIVSPKVNAFDDKIALIYHKYFPNNKRVIAPLERLTAYEKSVAGGGGDDKALVLLALLAQKDVKSPDITIEKFSYQNNLLTVQLLASSSNTLSHFISDLTQSGLAVKQQNASLRGEAVDAILEVK